jgi:rhodanese-related sulfurtransferase
MMKLEPMVWALALTLSSSFVVYEGVRRAQLDAARGIDAKELYRALSSAQAKLQIVDIRGDVEENYEDVHVPGAIPFPGCDLEKTPPLARDRIVPSIPTIIVSADGDIAAADAAACSAFFTSVRTLNGGIEAWSDENLPEDSGEFIPPKPSAGGGCL